MVGLIYEEKFEKEEISLGGFGLGFSPQTNRAVIFETDKMDAFGKKMKYKENDEIVLFDGKQVTLENYKEVLFGFLKNAKTGDKLVVEVARKKKNGKGSEKVEDVPSLILTVTENGYGKRTPIEEYRLQSRGGKGVINVKTTERNGRVVGIMLVDESSEAMLISHFGKIIRIDTKQIREAGRSTQGVRLLNLEAGDKVASAVVIPENPEEDPNGTLLQ